MKIDPAKLRRTAKDLGLRLPDAQLLCAQERFLVRIMSLPEGQNFIWKGGSLVLRAYRSLDVPRFTVDIDLMIQGLDIDKTTSIFESACRIDLDDGFDFGKITIDRMQRETPYGGYRYEIEWSYDNRPGPQALKIDVCTGDTVKDEIRALKDFIDLWSLSKIGIDQDKLAEAIKYCFKRRGTELDLQRLAAILTDDLQIKEMVAVARKRFGRIDALINMIGPFAEKNLLEETPANWRRAMDLNLNVVFSTCHYFQNDIIESKGHILNFGYSGVENINGWQAATAYAAAKAGLAVLTKSLAQAMAPHGVRVNAVCSGWIDSGYFSEVKLREIVTQIPQRRAGKPEDVSSVVQWLLNESSTYITGSLIPVSGGLEFPYH